jgi:hypothetical protein
MLENRKVKLLILFLLLFFFLGASFILAQRPLEITYPEIPGAPAPVSTKTTLPDYINYIFQFSLFLGALISLGSFIYGGFRYLTSAGSPSVQKDAKSQISAGLLGLIILFSAYLILNTINPRLVAFEVSLPGQAPTALPVAGPAKQEPYTYIEIPLGGLIENLWGKRSNDFPGGFKPADCYQFDGNGEALELLEEHNRLDCIEKLSEAIQIKGRKLKEPIEELQKLYDCQNCCRDCCKNVCNWAECKEECLSQDEDGNWESCSPPANLYCEGTKNEGYWESCGPYECCENKGMVHQYYYQKCPYNCCEFFEECPCAECCGFEEEWCQRCNCICIKEDEEGEPVCCNFEKDTAEPYEDLLVKSLIDKTLLSEEEKENDPYGDFTDIKTALKELRIKLGLFPLAEELLSNTRICCPGDTCPPDNKTGVIDCLLGNSETKDLIIKILIGEPVDEDKLKEILKAKSVMTYLIENDWLSADKNLAKIMMREIGILKNEVAFNEIAWMGTSAEANDEWIELYNNTKENIDLTDWKLAVKDKFEIELSGIIPAQGFYLLENNENAVSDIEADLIYSGNLADSGEILGLYDEFGNLVEEMDCSSEWFAGDKNLKASMERINPQGCLNVENWDTNLSAKVEGERKEDYINGKDREENPIYGTPKNPNSVGVSTISYLPFGALVGEIRETLRREETLREKLILVLRKEENLEKMLKTKEAVAEILTGEDWRLKKLLNQRKVLQILLENEEKLGAFWADNYAKKVFKKILKIEKEEEWEEFLAVLPEAITNRNLIEEFQRDLQWVLDTRDLMRECEEAPISYDQLRGPEELTLNIKIEEVPEWKDIEKESRIVEGTDPATFYCYKPLW